MEKVTKIVLEFETYRQTLKGQDANDWFSKIGGLAFGNYDPKVGLEVAGANWKKRKLQKLVKDK